MNVMKTMLSDLKYFIILWLSQSLSSLGSAMTNYALVIWSYQQYRSALITALIAISSYAPYVMMSIFAGAFSDRWNEKNHGRGGSADGRIHGGQWIFKHFARLV